MGVLIITSTNPDLSFLLGKNPSSGPLIKPVGQGYALGLYPPRTPAHTCPLNTQPDAMPANSCYALWFRDGTLASSFAVLTDGSNGVYLDMTRYSSPLMYLRLVQDYFNSVLNKPSSKDTAQFEQCIYLSNVKVCRGKTLSSFEHLVGVQLEYQRIGESDQTISSTPAHHARYYSIRVRAAGTLQRLMSLVHFMLCAIAATNRETRFELGDDRVIKAVKLLNEFQGDYALRYLCASRLISSPKLFAKLQPELEAWHAQPPGTVKLHFGDSAFQRREHIAQHLTFQHSIVEVGCGEGYLMSDYAKRLSKVNKKLLYHAIDIDDEVLQKAKHAAQKRSLDNVHCWESVSAWWAAQVGTQGEEPVEIVVAEVVEHLEVDEATALIQMLFAEVKHIKRMIISTPNRDFNRYFHMPADTKRHWDHKWEMNRAEFEQWIPRLTANIDATQFHTQYLQLSDRIGTDSLTQGVLFVHV